jgi:hypothetical protein
MGKDITFDEENPKLRKPPPSMLIAYLSFILQIRQEVAAAGLRRVRVHVPKVRNHLDPAHLLTAALLRRIRARAGQR